MTMNLNRRLPILIALLTLVLPGRGAAPPAGRPAADLLLGIDPVHPPAEVVRSDRPVGREDLVPRMVPAKPARTALEDVGDPARIVLKFGEGTRVREVDGELFSPSVDLGELGRVLRPVARYRLRRLFRRPVEILDAERAAGERSTGRALADLNLYYLLTLPDNRHAALNAAVCDALNTLDFVEIAYPVPPAYDPVNCVDLTPTTPSFVASQDYREAAPTGIDVQAGWDAHPAARGIKDFWIVDVEQGWNVDHEDIDIDFEDVLNGPYDGEKRDHGTAVLGEINACDTGTDYGMIGIVPRAQIKMVDWNLEPTFAEAFDIAASHLAPGEIYLIEIQTSVGGRLVPMEYYQAEFDAIAAHTARGIVVVEAGGNGGEDLDDPFYGGRFDRDIRDSGAILVGAGTPVAHSPEWFTNYGSRVDCQGYGSNVRTTGYGDLWSSGIDQYYTDTFSGTSSASPIVTGAAAIVQLLSGALNGRTLTSMQIRDLLSTWGTPQGEPSSKHIGPLPDLAQIVTHLPKTLGWRVTLATDTPRVAAGGTLTIQAELTNLGPDAASVDVWTHVLLTSGAVFPTAGELVGPVTVTLDAGEAVSFTLNHPVPAGAAAGAYIYQAFAGTYDTDVKSLGHVHFEIQ
jgi:subtilisin family serine protease